MTYDYPYAPQPPQPPKKNKTAKILGIGIAGVLGLALFGGCVAAISSSGSDDKKGSTAASVAPADKPSSPAAKPKQAAPAPVKTHKRPKPTPTKNVVTFKVWGNAPAGVLGSLDITYGSDSENLKGTFKNGTFEATLPMDTDAMYYNVNAQLQGSGEIWCSVVVNGKTDKGHAAGDYNICDAQLSSTLFGGWG